MFSIWEPQREGDKKRDTDSPPPLKGGECCHVYHFEGLERDRRKERWVSRVGIKGLPVSGSWLAS
jgi:hypothetical protein